MAGETDQAENRICQRRLDRLCHVGNGVLKREERKEKIQENDRRNRR